MGARNPARRRYGAAPPRHAISAHTAHPYLEYPPSPKNPRSLRPSRTAPSASPKSPRRRQIRAQSADNNRPETNPPRDKPAFLWFSSSFFSPKRIIKLSLSDMLPFFGYLQKRFPKKIHKILHGTCLSLALRRWALSRSEQQQLRIPCVCNQGRCQNCQFCQSSSCKPSSIDTMGYWSTSCAR